MRARLRRAALVTTAALLGIATGACESDRDRAAAPPPGSSSPAAPSTAAAPSTTGGPTPATLAGYLAQKPTWRPCGERSSCTAIRVPVDYAAPGGPSLALAVVRLPAGDPARRIGSLLVNPGGPGASAVDYAKAASRVLSPAVRARYDVVGVDPRGVADSTPVRCQTARETDRYLAADGSPDDAAEQGQAVELARAFAARCRQRGGALLAHVGTADAARDLDVVRAVLGDRGLHYLGKSYGTYLGATYAELFPRRVARMVLDGAIDPSLSGAAVDAAQARGFELALESFVDDCLGRSGCPLPGPRAAAVRAVGELLQRVDRRPLETTSNRPLTESLATLGVATALYDRTSWSVLRLALARANDGDGDVLLALADVYADRKSDGTYESNSNDAIYAVNCLDRPYRPDLASITRQAGALAAVSPTFGRYLAWSSLPCAYWPVPASGRPHPIRAPGAPPILVVGTERDPATPVQWAVSLAGQLESGVLLRWDGDGHTAYRRGSTCVDAVVDRYLLDGVPPDDGTACR